MGRVEILTGRERRRSWSEEEKLRVLAEAANGESLASVARRHDLFPQQLYAWRRTLRERCSGALGAAEAVTFLPVAVEPEQAQARPDRHPRRIRTVEVTLANGRMLRVDPEIDATVLRRLVQALEQA